MIRQVNIKTLVGCLLIPSLLFAQPKKIIEVPYSTSDFYYGFNNTAEELKVQKIPDLPISGKAFRLNYDIKGGNLKITNGPNYYNRPLHTPELRTIINAGDRPAFLLWTNNQYFRTEKAKNWGIADLLGHCFIGISNRQQSKWLHNFSYCHTTFHPGWVEYELKDDGFKGSIVKINVVPHQSGAIYINIVIEGKSCDIIWSHGFIDYKPFGPAIMKNFQPRDFSLDQPAYAEGDTIMLHKGTAIFKDKFDFRNWVAVASKPVSNEVMIVEGTSRIDNAPLDLYKTTTTKAPVVVGKIQPVQIGEKQTATLVLDWGRDNDPVFQMKWAVNSLTEKVEEGKAYFTNRIETRSIKTPNDTLNTIFGFTVVAADAMWHPPGIVHTPYVWSAIINFFRNIYGITSIGDHERVASMYHLMAGNGPDGRMWGHLSSPQDEPKAAWYQSYGSVIDMLWHHYLWTNDKELLRKYAPVIDKVLAYEDSVFMDKRGLYKDKLSFWASDAFSYEEGSTVKSVFIWRAYQIRSWIAAINGEDDIKYKKRADEIKNTIYSHFWNEQGGYFYDSYANDVDKVPIPIAPAIYHPIEFGFPTVEQSTRMFNWMEVNLMSPTGILRVNNWYPITWSHHIYSPLETANGAVAAYKLRRSETGYKMLKGVINGTWQNTLVPGSIACLSNSKGDITTMDVDFGDGISLFLRAVVEGLYGIDMNMPRGFISFKPNFPADWNNAELTLPDVPVYQFKKNKQGKTETLNYLLNLKQSLKLEASIPVNGKVKRVSINNEDVKFTVLEAENQMVVNFNTKPDKVHNIIIEYLPVKSTVIQNNLTNVKTTRSADIIPVQGKVTTIAKDQKLKYEAVNLTAKKGFDFSLAHGLFPGEFIWSILWQIQAVGKPYSCFYNENFENDITGIESNKGVPFKINKEHILGCRFSYETATWSSKNMLPQIELTDNVNIEVNKPAKEVNLLFSGFCSPMSYMLNQLEVTLLYEGGNNLVYHLKTPDHFDIISQHFSVCEPIAIGWFGTAETLDELEPKYLSTHCYYHDGLKRKFMMMLHGDVLTLPGASGILKEIKIKAIQRQSGALIYGVTVGN